jgi:8-oxo-dGTP pyrophosphatase MutT (NUDIX family)
MTLFRFVAGELGIYAAVDRDCLKSDPRRFVKPDGSWLKKVGTDFPGAISYWTEAGLEKYIQSGLQDWHRAVVREDYAILLASEPEHFFYKDEYQVLGDRFAPTEKISGNEFFRRRSKEKLAGKVGVFVTRDVGHGTELLLFRAPDSPDPTYQFPGGSLEPNESPLQGALRELEEESGIRVLQAQQFHETIYFKVYAQQYQHRYCFHVPSRGGLPEGWEHRVEGSGEDLGMRFDYAWFPLSDLPPSLLRIEGVAETLLRLEALLA